jgi:TRAP-type C4-dicarboxylate transport system permease small subunit
LRVSGETLRALRAQYAGCLCVACLQALSQESSDAQRASAAPSRTLALDRALDAGTAALMPLAIAVTVLLFLQWPLRDLIGTGSTQANDLAQWLFACYVALSLRQASSERAHLTARGDLATACDPTSPQRSRWRAIFAALCLLPWALALLVFDAPAAWHSLRLAERFPETNNPGYFMTHVALLALALLATWQGARDLFRALRPLPD